MGHVATTHLCRRARCPHTHPPQCDAKTQCFTCWPEDGCQALYDYNRLTVSEHGKVMGAFQIRAEILARGPISCGVDATDNMDSYKGKARRAVGGDSRGRCAPTLSGPNPYRQHMDSYKGDARRAAFA